MPRRTTSAFCAISLAAALVGPARPAWSAPPASAGSEEDEGESPEEATVEEAITAWRKGEWTEVRNLLEPLVRDGEGIEDPYLRESALRYLTEATLFDEGLEQSEREELARGYIDRLLDADPDWTPPSGLHGRRFYDLVAELRAERDAEATAACRGKLLTCEADLSELRADYRSAQAAYAELQERYDAQEVERVEVRQRNRAVSFVPLGVGHFTNGRFAIGGSFLALEAAAGIAGLSLIVYRNTALGCQRTAGFAAESLQCVVDASSEETLDAVRQRVGVLRNVEAAMGWTFIGLVILDVTLSQVLFEPYEFVDKGAVPRSELEAADAERSRRDRRRDPREGSEDEAEAGEDAEPPAGPPPRSGADQPSAKLRLRPSPMFLPGGGGLGVLIEF